MSEEIVIGDVRPRVQLVADGSNKDFQFNFPIFQERDLIIYLDDVTNKQIFGDDYSIDGVGETEGGKVQFKNAPSQGTVVTLLRNIIIERTFDFAEGGPFHAQVMNRELDYLVSIAQEHGEQFRRNLSLDPTDKESSLYLPKKEERQGKVMAFDDAGEPVPSVSILDVENAAQFKAETQQARDVSVSQAARSTQKAQEAYDNALVAKEAKEQAEISARKTRDRFVFVAQNGQTSVSGADVKARVLKYVSGNETVFLNGVRLVPVDDYTATTGVSITFLAPLEAGDVIEVEAFGSFSITAEMQAIENAGDEEVVRVKIEGQTQTSQMQIHSQKMADTVNTKHAGGFFEMDTQGDIMPTLSPLYSKIYELDANGDIQPI